MAKALLMGVLVAELAVSSFTKSLILVLVSASATGVFGIIIVLIQTHSDKALHTRIDSLEGKADATLAKAETIEGAVTPSHE